MTQDRKMFHRMPYKLKKSNPADHSCALCIHRPIDFCKVSDSDRMNPYPLWEYKKDVTYEHIFNAQMKDGAFGTTKYEDELKIFRKCKTLSWSKSVPFYPNEYKCFEGE